MGRNERNSVTNKSFSCDRRRMTKKTQRTKAFRLPLLKFHHQRNFELLTQDVDDVIIMARRKIRR